MLFNSPTFILLFLPLTLLGFFLLGAKGWRRAAIAWLVFASAVFYAWFRADYLLVLAVLVVFNYLYGIKLSRDYQLHQSRLGWLAIGIAVNLGVLAYFKYTNFFVDNVNVLFGTNFVLQKIILPIGISFFTFQKIAYLVDAYRGEAEEYDFLDFSLFVMYFPQLIAGPITHHKEIIPQFRQASILRLSLVDLAAGLTLFAIGLFKKVVIADQVVLWSDTVFAAAAGGAPLSFLESWGGALAFTFQIYFDFSGYTDMALGLALMIGIRLPLNFNSPYKATSIIDFWRRWHMTLSRFLRDYVYIALGGNRRGPLRRYINLMATMLIGGLWHGAAWTFVVWGGLHGIYLVINHGWHALRDRFGLTRPSSTWSRGVARLLTFVAVVLAWVFFRAESFQAARVVLDGMTAINGVGLPAHYAEYLGSLAQVLRNLGVSFNDAMLVYSYGWPEAVGLLVLLLMVWFTPNSQELLARFRPALTVCEPARCAALFRRVAIRLRLAAPDGSFALTPATGLLVGATLLGGLLYQAIRTTTLHPFIYFQF